MIPDAKTTPKATIKIPADFPSVIVSPKKKKPPIKASIGVKAPNAAVCAGPNCRIAKLYNSIATIAISRP